MTIKIDDFTTLKLEKGKDGNFYLNSGWINRDGEWKPTRVKRTFGSKGEKEVGLSIKLGDQGLAEDVLTQLFESVSSGNV